MSDIRTRYLLNIDLKVYNYVSMFDYGLKYFRNYIKVTGFPIYIEEK
jgi:hypothetical protein